MERLQINPDAELYVTPERALIARNKASGATLQLSPNVLVVLSQLVAPREADQVVADLDALFGLDPDDVAAALDHLIDHEIVGPESAAMPESSYFAGYGELGIHRLMVADHARTDAFRRAIEAVVTPGARVLDIGCGTGILSLFAARAGAGHVDAVDNAQILEYARALADDNGLADAITFHGGDIDAVALDGPYDVIVSEWLGHFAVTENMYTPVFAARDRLLAPGGAMVPSAVTLWLAPVEEPHLHARTGPGAWTRPVFGFDFSRLAKATLRTPIAEPALLPLTAYLAAPAQLVRVDCATDPTDAFHQPMSTRWEVERAGMLHGFAGHFTCELGGGVTLDTSSAAVPTHWQQHYFPTEALALERGDVLEVTLHVLPMLHGRRNPIVTLSYRVTRGATPVAEGSARYNTTV
ncbi:MAG: methyltransferase domain-containing protein [Myxococcota bacterium]